MRNLERYVAASEAVIAQAQRIADGEENGPCSGCKWSRFSLNTAYCGNPIVQLNGQNTLDSYDAERIVECDQQRQGGSYYGKVICGPSGTLFEPREPSFWDIFR